MHKLVYVVKNVNHTATRLMVLPYLHEKRMYLNREKQNTKYFYTSLEPDVPPYLKYMTSPEEF